MICDRCEKDTEGVDYCHILSYHRISTLRDSFAQTYHNYLPTLSLRSLNSATALLLRTSNASTIN